MRKRLPVEKINNLPSGPGVYFLKNKKREIFYIGKSNNIRSRVGSHLRDGKWLRMYGEQLIASVEWIKTANEIEALIREAEYIKHYQPKLNARLRDDKQYLYVGITREELPRIFVTHQPKSTNGEQRTVKNKKILNTEYIGPFTDAGALKATMRWLRKIVPYYTTSPKKPLASPKHKALLCSYCHIGMCPGPKVSKKEYRRDIATIRKILSGKKDSAIKKLRRDMKKAARGHQYEEAAHIRDVLTALSNIFSHHNMVIPWTPQRQSYNDPIGVGTRRPFFEEALTAKTGLAPEGPQVRGSSRTPLERSNHDSEKKESPGSYLARLLKKDLPIKTIEGYDISNIQGREPTASMVRFDNGKPNKSLYRTFNIQAPPSPNDTLMMREVIRRRFGHPEWPHPDLILIDGGRGQLNAAQWALRDLGLTMRVISLAKKLEELYMPSRKNPIPLKTMPLETQNLLKYIRDEAHRFAISHHRARHRKTFQ